MQSFAMSVDELGRCREVLSKQAQKLGDICDQLAVGDGPTVDGSWGRRRPESRHCGRRVPDADAANADALVRDSTR
jgi:hypothetical protein